MVNKWQGTGLTVICENRALGMCMGSSTLSRMEEREILSHCHLANLSRRQLWSVLEKGSLKAASHSPRKQPGARKELLEQKRQKKSEMPSWLWAWQENVFSPTVAIVNHI